MALRPIDRRSAPEHVYEQIMGEVLSGEMKPGEYLPSERRLAEVFGVSRPTVREALMRVAAAGLIEVRQGDATLVRDFRRHATLDLLPKLLTRGGEVDYSVVRSMLEVRQHIGPKVAELAAQRRTPESDKTLREVLQQLAAEENPVEQLRLRLAFFDHIVDAADSIVYRLMFNNLRAAYEPALSMLATVVTPDVSPTDGYVRLAQAIAAGNAKRAFKLAHDVLEPGTTTMIQVLDQLESLRAGHE